MAEQKHWEKYSKNHCINCDKKVSNNSKRCQKCYGLSKIKYNGEKIKYNGEISIDKDYLSKKNWANENEGKSKLSKDKWLRNNKNKRKEVCKEWNKRNPEKLNEKQKRYAKKYPEKIKARNLSRKVIVGNRCSMCGSNKNLEKHHPNYFKPKEIMTLCINCHRRLHHAK